jgi:iron complex outermembrane receptor protein
LPFNSKFQLYNLTYDWNLPGVSLTATGSYYRYDILRSTDFTGSYIALKNNAARCGLWSGTPGACGAAQLNRYNNFIDSILPVTGWQPAWLKSKNFEVRAASSGDGPFNWTIGGYYEDRHDHIDSNTSLADPATGATYLPLRNRAYRYVETKMTQKAAFAELSYALMEGLTATYGARYYDYKKTVQGQNLMGDILFASFPGAFSSVTANANGWLHKFNLAYQANRRLMVYATASKGFRPGGANNIPTLPTGLVNYSPDSLWNYELGAKTSWLNGALVVNGAIYQIDWSNMQTSARTADGVFSFITNAGAARVRGAELEVTARPIQGLTWTGGLGYVDAKLTENQANSSTQLTGTTGRAGDRLPNVPKWTLSSTLSYSWPLTGDINGLLRADWAYTGPMQSSFRPDTDPYFERYGKYSTIGLRAGIETDRHGIYLFVQNLTDKAGITGASSSFGIERQIYTIAPRTIGINGRVSF